MRLKATVLLLLMMGCELKKETQPEPVSVPVKKRICACDTDIQRDHEYYNGRVTYIKDFTGRGLGKGEAHGTHVVGRMARHADAEIGFGRIFVGRTGYSSWIYNCFKDLTDNGNCKVINYSGGSEKPRKWTNKGIEYAISKGVRVVTSAGNAYCSFPGKSGINGLVVVGALNRAGKKLYCLKADAYELGASVLSTLPGNKFGRMSGTSMASPRHAARMYNDE